MDSNKKLRLMCALLTCATVIFFQTSLMAQHRGDNLSFQGLSFQDNISAKASAMGGAVMAVPGDISSLWYNTSGLARISSIQISINGNSNESEWRESQDYFPNRQFVTLPLYLDGLYTPLRVNSGRWDYELYRDTVNPYIVRAPKLGLDPYSKDAADWTKSDRTSAFKNAAVAVPFEAFDYKFVAAAGYLRTNILDYDRNDTYLSPFYTSYDYESGLKWVNGVDTLVMKWSRFIRQRKGSMNTINAGISSEPIENVMFGIGTAVSFGRSDDFQSLVRIGDFHLIQAENFSFYFVDTSTTISGTSKYSSIAFNVSTMIDLDKVKLGLRVDLPYTLSRKWDYIRTEKGADTIPATESKMTGTDKLKMPAIYYAGISFQPLKAFKVCFSYTVAPYTKASYTIASGDSSFRKWADQKTLSLGMSYEVNKYVTLMTGYRSIPEVFVPDGAAVRTHGPEANSYNLGASINTIWGTVDMACEYRMLKYYDSYFSNTNYAYESTVSLLLGYTYKF